MTASKTCKIMNESCSSDEEMFELADDDYLYDADGGDMTKRYNSQVRCNSQTGQ